MELVLTLINIIKTRHENSNLTAQLLRKLGQATPKNGRIRLG